MTEHRITHKFLLPALVLIGFAAQGQSELPEPKERGNLHEISLTAGGSFSGLDFELSGGESEDGPGAVFAVGYSYYLTDNWSLGIGAEYQNYQTTALLNGIQGSYSTTDMEAEDFEFRYSAREIREEHSLHYINLPLKLQYETSGATRFFAAAGAKVGFANRGTYQFSHEGIETSGFYPQYNVELHDPAFMGFGTFVAKQAPEQELDIKTAVTAILEAGVAQDLGPNGSLYLGFFLDYGLNKIYEGNSSKEVVEYTPAAPAEFQYNSLFEAGLARDMKIRAIGLKLRYGFKI